LESLEFTLPPGKGKERRGGREGGREARERGKRERKGRKRKFDTVDSPYPMCL